MSYNNIEWHVGQEVAVFHRDKISRITRVERITKTLVILKNGERFKKNGFRPGDQWYNVSLYPMTDELRRRFKHDRLVYRMQGVDRHYWRSLPTEALEQIAKILDANQPKEEPQ